MAIAAVVVAACNADDPPPTGDPTPGGTPTAAETASPTATPTAATSPPGATNTQPADGPTIGEAWERVADAPVALTEVAATAHDGGVWVAGGFRSDGSAGDSVLVYDPASDEWSDGPRLRSGVHHAALVSTGDRLVLLGGYLGGGFNNPTDEVWALEDGAATWQQLTPLPEARGAGAAAWDGERIVFGGGMGPAQLASDVFALVGDTWETVGQLAAPREHLAAASDGAGRTWFMGGRRGGMESNTGRVELVEGSEITLLEQELTPRGGVGAFWIGSVGACLVGGEEPGGTLALVECVGDGGEVTELPSLEVPRHGLGVAVLDDAVYAVLGGDAPGLFVTAVTERLPLD